MKYELEWKDKCLENIFSYNFDFISENLLLDTENLASVFVLNTKNYLKNLKLSKRLFFFFMSSKKMIEGLINFFSQLLCIH